MIRRTKESRNRALSNAFLSLFPLIGLRFPSFAANWERNLMPGTLWCPDTPMNLLSFSALKLADLIHSRQISSEEAVGFFLSRAQKYNPEVNAFVDFFDRRARFAASRKDRQGSQDAFHGVPIGVKDLNFVRGTRTRMGSRAFQYLIAPFDDVDVKSLKKSGVVIIGKTATSEVGVLPVTEPDTHPPTRNPWNHRHTAGGSSGGAGAAVSARLLPFAHGSDGGGSVRIPASVCGLFGFKPSRGRLPYPDAWRSTRKSRTVPA